MDSRQGGEVAAHTAALLELWSASDVEYEAPEGLAYSISKAVAAKELLSRVDPTDEANKIRFLEQVRSQPDVLAKMTDTFDTAYRKVVQSSMGRPYRYFGGPKLKQRPTSL